MSSMGNFMEEKDQSTSRITITLAHLADLRDKLLQLVGANSPTIGACTRKLDIELFQAFNPHGRPIVRGEKIVTFGGQEAWPKSEWLYETPGTYVTYYEEDHICGEY